MQISTSSSNIRIKFLVRSISHSQIKNFSFVLIFIVLVYLKYQMMTLGGGVLGKLEQVGAI